MSDTLLKVGYSESKIPFWTATLGFRSGCQGSIRPQTTAKLQGGKWEIASNGEEILCPFITSTESEIGKLQRS